MTELESAIALIRKEISKHEMDLRRAELRNGARDEELQRLRDKIELKNLIVEKIPELTQMLDSYRLVLRDKLIENRTLKTQLAMITKGEDASGEKGLDGRLG